MNTYELFVIGRCLIAVMFIASVFGNASNWRQSISLMQIHHLPFPDVALSAALVLQSTGAICLVIGRILYPAVFGLSIFVVMATVAIPLQDALNGKDREGALRIIGSNAAILGALLLVLASRGF